jgi:hypothetical protein
MFNGQPKNLASFLKECKLYLQMNRSVYNTNKKKVGYILSLMMEGTAAIWRDNFLCSTEDETETYAFPNYRNFIQLLEHNFQSTDEKAEALYQLGRITQGSHLIQDHNATSFVTRVSLPMTEANKSSSTTTKSLSTTTYSKKFGEPIPNRVP